MAAIVGAIIGIIGSLLGACLPLIWAVRYNRFQGELEKHDQFLMWLRGIIPECEYIVVCVDELATPFVDTMAGRILACATKRLNSDFLEAARLGILKHPRGANVFLPLTTAYRNVTHTNEMMDRAEQELARARGSQNPHAIIGGIFGSTIASLNVTRGSLTDLIALLREQEQLTVDHPPQFALFSFPAVRSCSCNFDRAGEA